MSDEIFLYFLIFGLPIILLVIYFVGVRISDNQINEQESSRIAKIKSRDWGNFEQSVINREIEVGMTFDMVSAAWGRPNTIDQVEETEKYKKERWVYGIPRRGSGANYVTFRDGIVKKTVVNHYIQGPEGLNKGIFIGILFAAWILLCGVLTLMKG